MRKVLARAIVLSRAFIFGLWLAMPAAGALAHGHGGPSANGGIEIPGITHGEMAAVATHAQAIRALAQERQETDPTFRRLVNFAALQRTFCLWGLMPGAVGDEESPFNECMHAYLAALRAILIHMRDMPGGEAQARALEATLDRDIARSNGICRRSGETFNTAAVIIPRWRDIFFHPPSLLAAATALALAGAAGSLLFRGGRA